MTPGNYETWRENIYRSELYVLVYKNDLSDFLDEWQPFDRLVVLQAQRLNTMHACLLERAWRESQARHSDDFMKSEISIFAEDFVYPFDRRLGGVVSAFNADPKVVAAKIAFNGDVDFALFTVCKVSDHF